MPARGCTSGFFDSGAVTWRRRPAAKPVAMTVSWSFALERLVNSDTKDQLASGRVLLQLIAQ